MLLPRAVLPLHIFEARYRTMTRDALEGDRLIALALLRPGYEVRYHCLNAAIWPEVCVGRILRSERLPDGRLNLLLQGAERARVLRENTRRAYRRGLLSPIRVLSAGRHVEEALREEIRAILRGPILHEFAAEKNWLELFRCPDFQLSDLVDVLASAVLPDLQFKQRFLAEPSVQTRATCIRDVLEALSGELLRRRPLESGQHAWPPVLSPN